MVGGESIRERFADIATPAGTMPTFVVHPERGGPFPAVIVYMDFWGVREELHDIARSIARAGHCCLLPDLYYRQGAIRNEIRDAEGKMTSLSRLDAETQAKVLAPLRRLSDAEAMDDTQAMLEFLADDKAAHGGPKGCVGFCLGGRLAIRAAARFPGEIKAAASLHGSALVSERADSPHHSAAQLQGELYCGFAGHDPYTLPSTIEDLVSAMKSSPATFSYQVHRGTEHGYALPNRDIYDESAARRDWELILAMFRRQLG
jgi:carboxymethylenebutenolidase